MSQMRDVEAALEAWRAAERALTGIEASSPDRAIAEAQVERLRDEYQALTYARDAQATAPDVSADEIAGALVYTAPRATEPI